MDATQQRKNRDAKRLTMREIEKRKHRRVERLRQPKIEILKLKGCEGQSDQELLREEKAYEKPIVENN